MTKKFLNVRTQHLKFIINIKIRIQDKNLGYTYSNTCRNKWKVFINNPNIISYIGKTRNKSVENIILNANPSVQQLNYP